MHIAIFTALLHYWYERKTLYTRSLVGVRSKENFCLYKFWFTCSSHWRRMKSNLWSNPLISSLDKWGRVRQYGWSRKVSCKHLMHNGGDFGVNASRWTPQTAKGEEKWLYFCIKAMKHDIFPLNYNITHIFPVQTIDMFFMQNTIASFSSHF